MNTGNGNRSKVYGSSSRFVFDGFEIDPTNRTCVRDGISYPVTGKVFDVLMVFVDSPGRLLTKDELIDCLWPDESNGFARRLIQAIQTIRYLRKKNFSAALDSCPSSFNSCLNKKLSGSTLSGNFRLNRS